MADAKKCDLCKRCFDPLEQGMRLMVSFRNPVFKSAKDISENKVGAYLIEGAPDRMVDLCPDCTENFQLFMTGSPLAVEKGYFDKPDIPEKSGDRTAFQRFLEQIDQAGNDFWREFLKKNEEDAP